MGVKFSRIELQSLTFTRTDPNTWTADDYTITRWRGHPYRYDHTSAPFCYMVQYRGESLTILQGWQQPADLATAKRQAQQYHDLLTVRKALTTT